jgi:hypothetical protein
MVEIQGMPQKSNPLANFMRQPKIYIRLPSGGKYWSPGSIQIPDNGELAVYSMTAKDELAFKTPDALMNGQAVVDVIQSCIPGIKNAWACPNIDMDYILIAIRIATYGEMMEISHVVPNTSEIVEHEINLQSLLDQMSNNTWDEVVPVNDLLTCFVRPLTYKHLSLTGMKAFETQRLMESINNNELPDEKKMEIFNQSFGKMTAITIDLIADSIMAIQTPDAVVNDQRFIKEFLQNADKETFSKVQRHINRMKEINGLQPFEVRSTPEQQESGAPETYTVPIQFDNSNFFAPDS